MFHRLFGNKEAFHRAFLDYFGDVHYDHEAAELLNAMEVGAEQLPDIDEDYGFHTATLLAAIYWGDGNTDPIPEAVIYPWTSNWVVRDVIAHNAATSIGAESSAVVSLLVDKGIPSNVANAMAPRVVAALAASNLAVRLVTDSNGLDWPVAEWSRSLTTMELTFGRSAAAIVRSFLNG